jgi:large subunit ribosomal protein L5
MEKSRLKAEFFEQIVPKMVEKFKFSNKYQVPRITKIVLSMGLGKRDVKKNLDDLTLIAGQQAVITKAKKSVSQFNVRAGFDSGAMVTLRNNGMYHFLDRLLNIALLNWRSFSGIPKKSFNKQKFVTLSLGIPDKRIFSEIYSDTIRSEGLNITICSNATNIEEFKTLLMLVGFPIIGGA